MISIHFHFRFNSLHRQFLWEIRVAPVKHCCAFTTSSEPAPAFSATRPTWKTSTNSHILLFSLRWAGGEKIYVFLPFFILSFSSWISFPFSHCWRTYFLFKMELLCARWDENICECCYAIAMSRRRQSINMQKLFFLCFSLFRSFFDFIFNFYNIARVALALSLIDWKAHQLPLARITPHHHLMENEKVFGKLFFTFCKQREEESRRHQIVICSCWNEKKKQTLNISRWKKKMKNIKSLNIMRKREKSNSENGHGAGIWLCVVRNKW